MKAAIIGVTGYGGAELVRILHQHPEVSIHSFHSSSQQGNRVIESYPHLQSITAQVLEDIHIEKIGNEADFVFLATPSGVAANLVPQLMNQNVKVIDLSGDFRIKNREVYKKWYKKEAAEEHWLNEAVYGLTEWLDTDLKEAKLISNPGCYPTATLLGLAPLVKNKLIDEKSIIIDAKSGVSGAGRNVSPVTHFSETNENLKIYKVNEHQHIPEIEQVLSGWNPGVRAVTFSTHLIPMTRGIMATIYASASIDTNIDQLFDLYRETYEGCYFIRIREKGTFPSTKEVYGSNFCDISLAYDERTNRIMVVSVIDNLMKGAAGQAVQNMNMMLGLDEKTGLDFVPVYP
ncbi:N-acetyl-gamma-glutamyl-phosphate reductase [Pueribacillus theae]|uniref:N-acetyl-gamma-glutamyl-phosphate reductase n=1 Tax=Pueribacillus theae TaxID=2171751 RepID=A0A2U1K6F5_9BACI|nr:N-acetyl-gamma-glutamyl-phosphate reductase [Pueribacillus theae]PWA12749.1 N-acetyl-gamma-glutamyl-phosphate reductase [Pueribacillus theae]